MSSDAFAEFERAGWERAAPRYEEYWTDTVLFVKPLLDAAGVRAESRLLDVACGPGFVSEAAAARGAHPVGVDIATAMVEPARCSWTPSPRSGACRAQTSFSKHSSTPESASPQSCGRSRPTGSRPSAR